MFLQWDAAWHFAIEQLATKGLTASHKLSLAICYRIHDWIEPVFQYLMDTLLQNFTVDDSALLGQQIMILIVTTQAAIHHHWLLVAYNLLKLHHHDTACNKTLATCQCNWETAWWDGLACHYLHPNFPCSPQDILLKLEKTPVMGVTTECWLRGIETIKAQWLFELENDMKMEALMKLQTFEGPMVNLALWTLIASFSWYICSPYCTEVELGYTLQF
jgi:hypothetical protein